MNYFPLFAENKCIKSKELTTMKMKSVMTGLGIGMAVGGAAGLGISAMGNPSAKKMYKKKAAKALKAMENMFDDMQDMFK